MVSVPVILAGKAAEFTGIRFLNALETGHVLHLSVIRNGYSPILAKKRKDTHMEKMIAYCGLVCTSCPTYLATLHDDDVAREQTAALYSEKFGLNLRPDEINCDGCLSEGGILIAYCQECEIRNCCREKELTNCAFCNEQPCVKLQKFHQFSPDAKESFELLFKELNQ